ncbi:flagellar basal body P-ring protein FlgI [Shewanella fidelis]|uniref:Flagellar P-ring protein n=2 Tax=Shewanella fidelis TaxID=173509 RepID=A0AAW8NRV8_9GAMM|nr:flagellar basal body P-ring protein FlgI [Shewanella fidelis]MDW4813898.1 flagellar basal body P-ring protein FlgI [Shewanella fidelis]MDW4817910.1 flagellar basal body P-ring protein FlgI [Shewanella fidelis]MDW4821977.1 flagellar basal body P-ring protein FlgI [Shewanella fidelis]MDW4826142.1 flagellar basal body P-ring protein FlgI [Shewanella fidelis]
MLLSLVPLLPAQAQVQHRYLMDIVDVQGIRDNQLVGYGLVVGLDGTGDRTQVRFTSQSIVNMLKQFGVQIDDKTDPKLKNVAAVAVHATVPPLASPGQTLDITVSSLGDAKSLRGGTLLMTPMRAVDGEIYAVAQGNLVVGGISAQGRNGSSVTINVPTVGNIPNGALLEAPMSSDFNDNENIVLNLIDPSFKTARNIERAVNELFGPDVATADSSAKVIVRAPKSNRERVTFMSMLEELQIEQGRKTPRVVFNSRTGTVVMGGDVVVRKAAVSHGNLTVTIVEQESVSQPNGAYLGQAQGETVVTTDSQIDIDTGNGHMFVWPEGIALNDIVRAVNSLGASPMDLMAILQALNEAGALEAELVVI